MATKVSYAITVRNELVDEYSSRPEALLALSRHLIAHPEDTSDLRFATLKSGRVVFAVSGNELVEFMQDTDVPAAEDDEEF
jgi:hypothetical protein